MPWGHFSVFDQCYPGGEDSVGPRGAADGGQHQATGGGGQHQATGGGGQHPATGGGGQH